MSAGSNVGSIAADQLCSFVSRIERLEEEVKGLQGDKAEIYAECKATGFDVRVLKKLMQRRRMERNDVQEQDAILELYESIVNGGIGRAAARRPADPLDD